ncbi:MAG TPA: Gfo/Idh/MocA family oxidoreductase [Candidatus Limnocylindrales bacterium]|nr:Gfo/Idh/MocA family oxidoreductase [Candidatus Limnocylindrales bacterium]
MSEVLRTGNELRIGMIGAGTMAGAHSAALANLPHLYRGLTRRPRLVAVADVNVSLANALARRFGYERVADDAAAVIGAVDIDLVVACLPPALNRAVVLAAAAAGKHVVCEKPLAESAEDAVVMLRACQAAGVFHGLGAGYRWSPAVRAIGRLIGDGELGTIRSIRACFMLDYAADPEVPLLWRFRKSLAGGGIAIDTGYHLVDCARFLVGEIVAVQALSATFITERPLPGADAVGNRGGGTQSGQGETGPVDVEDAAAALVNFESGAYGVLETSRVAIGKRVSLQIEVYGSRGSAGWDLERPDEFRVCLPGDPFTFGFRRVLVNAGHPGAAELLMAGTDGTSIGWLGQECAMWAEFVSAIAEGRPGSANFSDGVRDSAVLDALYAAAASGVRTTVVVPAGL